jgi:hypothetical protein
MRGGDLLPCNAAGAQAGSRAHDLALHPGCGKSSNSPHPLRQGCFVYRQAKDKVTVVIVVLCPAGWCGVCAASVG